MKIEANGIMMNYELAGEGPCLALIHGAGDNLKMWYNQVTVFSQRYQVLTYDVRGFGLTQSLPGEYSMALFAEDLYQLLQALNIGEAFLLGYSMGGRIALELAIQHPKVAKALVLANSGVGGPRPPEAVERFRFMLELLQKGDVATIAEEMTTGAFSPGFKEKNPEAFERYKAVKLEVDPQSFAQAMMALAEDIRPPDVGRIQCPTLIICGENDSYMTPDVARSMQQAIPGSELMVMSTGHAAAIEAPESFNTAVLEFLSRLA